MSTTSTIGTSSRNYATITLWHAAFANGGWIGECYNDTEFNETPSIGGSSGTNYEILRPATGQSAFDTANPLKYDVTKGVGLKNAASYATVLTVGGFCTVQRMQVTNTGSGNADISIKASFGAASVIIDRCLAATTTGTSGNLIDAIKLLGGAAQTVTNSVLICYNGNGIALDYANSAVLANNTIVAPSDKSNTRFAISISSGSPKITNCAGFGFGGGFSSGGTPTGSNNATDQATISFGSSNLTSQTYANQFTGVTTASQDFRLKSGNTIGIVGGVGKGATDTTDIPSAIDIFATSRVSGQWSIGAYQDVGSAPVTNFTSTLMMMGVG